MSPFPLVIPRQNQIRLTSAHLEYENKYNFSTSHENSLSLSLCRCRWWWLFVYFALFECVAVYLKSSWHNNFVLFVFFGFRMCLAWFGLVYYYMLKTVDKLWFHLQNHWILFWLHLARLGFALNGAKVFHRPNGHVGRSALQKQY